MSLASWWNAELLPTKRSVRMAYEFPEDFPVAGSVYADSGASALCASMPVVFPEGIETFGESSPPTVVVWLFPIMPTEAQLVEDVGWSEFEDRLQAANPPLFDYRRMSIV